MQRSGRAHRRALLVIGLLLLSSACATAPTPPQPPKIVFEDTTRDFGHVEQGAAVRHQFTFHNGGGLDLTIDNVRASCGCVATTTASRAIVAGGSGAIQVTFDTGREVGRTVRTITVYSNDPTSPVTALTLRGDIDADVAAEPPQLYLGHVRAGQTVPSELRIVTPRDGASVGAVEASGPVIEATATDPSRRHIRVAVRKDAPAGRFREQLSVRITSARHPLVTIPIAGTVDADGLSTGSTVEHKW